MIMKFIPFLAIALAALNLTAAELPGPHLKNNSDSIIHYLINGGKTEKACSFIGIGTGNLAANSQLTKIEYSNKNEVKYLCLLLSEAKDEQTSVMIKIAADAQCIVNIDNLNKISLSEACKKGLKNDK